jgi:hypothetical protein
VPSDRLPYLLARTHDDVSGIEQAGEVRDESHVWELTLNP